jgi:LuxR family transcriptional regulator, maltose regulon positive regulatory protein
MAFAVGAQTTAPIRTAMQTIEAREAAASAADRYDLQDAKLSVPQPGRGSIRRARLIRQFQAVRDRRIVAIFAPPGYGKTTALAQWAANPRDKIPWVTVDEGDNDPVALFTDVAIALDRRAPMEPSVFDRLARPGMPTHSLVGRLLSAASERPAPIRFILDDAHRLTARACLEALGELITRLPPGGQVAIAGRQAVDLPLPRWRSQGAIAEVGIDELALDLDECSEMLRKLGLELSIDHVKQIHQSSEGWPAGIYLAAIAAANAGATKAGPTPSGSDSYIAEYFEAEVLKPLDRQTVTFLRRTAILERLAGPICDDVADVVDGASTLDRLARINHLVLPLDAKGVWYRYHTLLREFLLADLERREPRIIPDLHRRASAWFERHGHFEEAIDHAFAADDADGAARIYGGIAGELYYSGRTTTARAIIDRFDWQQLHKDPWLATIAALYATYFGDVERADRMGAVASHSTYEGVPPDGSASFESMRAMLWVVRSRGGVAGMRTNADAAVAAEPPASLFRAFALNCSAVASLAAGDDSRAETDLIEAISAAEAASATEDEQFALSLLALLAIGSVDWARARSFADAADSIIESSHLALYPTTALAGAVSARVAIHHGDHQGATSHLGRAAVLRPQLTYAMPWVSVRSLLELARAHLALADPAGARAVLRQAEAIVIRRPDLGPIIEDVRALRRQLLDQPIGAGGASTLTAAELKVLTFLPLHLSFKEIADRLGVRPSTTKTHALSVYGKLGATSRTEAVALAIAAGLLEASL